MGVYNPNGHMPTNCYDCYEERYADCDIHKGLDKASNYKDRRYENCPLVEILTPHGRIIDADKLRKSWYGDEEEHIFEFVMDYEVDNAPTILEAEE